MAKIKVEVLEKAGALRNNGKKYLPGDKLQLDQKDALKLEAEGIIKVIGKAKEIQVVPEPVGEPEILDPQPEIKPAVVPVVETKTTEVTPEPETPSVPVVEENKVAVEIKKTEAEVTPEIQAEIDRLVKDYTFPELKEAAKDLGITKLVGISAVNLAKDIVLVSIANQEK